MSYLGFGIRSINSFDKPRRVFKPIFEQLANGDHPGVTNGKSILKTWKETQERQERDALVEKVRANYIYLLLTVGILTSLLFAII